MKILVTESSMNWGGQEERTLSECKWLIHSGHQVRIMGNADSEIIRHATGQGLDTVTANFRFAASPHGLSAICREASRFSADVINCHSQRDSWMTVPTRFLGKPVVRTQNTSLPERLSVERAWYYRHGCNRIIAASNDIARQITEQARVPRERVSVIGEGVDCERFRDNIDGSAIRAEWGIPNDAPLFGVVGMLRGEKGQSVFIRAAALAWAKNPSIRFVLVGKGVRRNSSESELRELAAQKFSTASQSPLIFAGFETRMPEVMAALDVLVVPSIRDAQTLVIPQAFASGRPVIGTNVGGIPDLVTPDETGLLFPLKDHKTLADLMLQLAADPARRKRMGSNARRFANEQLTMISKFQSFEKILAETADGARSRSIAHQS